MLTNLYLLLICLSTTMITAIAWVGLGEMIDQDYSLFSQRDPVVIPQAELLPTPIVTPIAEVVPPLASKLPNPQPIPSPVTPAPSPIPPPSVAVIRPSPQISPTVNPSPAPRQPLTAIRGIYLSRYLATNNASEHAIRTRVRHYQAQGINTILHGVWGNGCTMYKSPVLKEILGIESCPNYFRPEWLDWLIDEAHQQGMEVHAYFEKGIKIDKNSPIFNRAMQENWLVSGVDRTYSGVDHYVLDVSHPVVAQLFPKIMAEFVTRYPQIDAVQWDDYLGYHAELDGGQTHHQQGDRTEKLTNFVRALVKATKQANAQVSFDLCHHNPYWAKRYFAADWKNWGVDRAFIQAYNEQNFNDEMIYAKRYDGIAITDNQLHRLTHILRQPQLHHILIFPLSGNPEVTASRVFQALQ